MSKMGDELEKKKKKKKNKNRLMGEKYYIVNMEKLVNVRKNN
jgi:hypothetical protein